MAVHFITSSADKFREVKDLWPEVERVDIDLPEIQSLDSEEIVRHKLEAARRLGVAPCLVEDTSLSVVEWNGLPGPLIKWFIQSLGVEGFANLVIRGGRCAVEARTVVGYIDSDGRTIFASGAVPGTIVPSRGAGFGWDAIFLPDGQTMTFGEMTSQEKGRLSMRAVAIGALRVKLKAEP